MITLELSHDAVLLIKDMIERVTLSARDPKIVETAKLIAEIKSSIDNCIQVIQKA